MSAGKGLIFLEAKSSILYEQLLPRILGDKREPCEITFYDFDNVHFKLSCASESLSVVQVHVAMTGVDELKKLGAQEVLDRLYPGMEIPPDKTYNYALQFDCDNLPVSDKGAFLTCVAELKRNLASGPLDRAFSALLAGTSGNLGPSVCAYRRAESMYVVPAASKVVVVFQVDFADITDKAVARVFLQEFVEAQRTVRTAPPVQFSKDPLGEMAGLPVTQNPDTNAGFISFALEERHLQGPGKEKAISLLTGFRNYLHYHIKCSKTYLHMRMRKRVATWMLVLNRAMPEIEGEKKTAGGKTFTRK
ncbi:arp2/3 [Ochromonadaceae sp. CCMP2298]|nr:arp2/3 [Ochromonadaceae sp. CCMP2298]